MRVVACILLSVICQFGFAATAMKGPAPDFTLKSNKGENLRLSEQRGKVVLINFWASWCGPCRQEMPLLDSIHKQFESLGFTVFGVNVDNEEKQANKTLKNIPVDFPVLYDPEKRVSKLYGVNAMPTTILVDRDGNMRYLHLGYQPGFEDKYIEQIKQLVKE